MQRLVSYLTVWGVVALLVSFAARVSAQSTGGEISFDKLVHDFGTLKEEVNEATYSFNFKNTGKAPLKLVDVKASCGCTSPSWSREPVAPGQVGFVTATYHTTGRPGEFNKTITVRAKADDQTDERVLVLTIKGNVTPRPKTIADYYPHKSGSLRFSSNHVALAKLHPGKTGTATWKLFNEGDQPVTIKNISGIPAHVTLGYTPGTVIKAKDSIQVKVTFDGNTVNDWGWVYHNLMVETDDATEPSKSMYVSAMVEEDFSAWTEEQKTNAPALSFEQTTHDFGKVTSGQKVTTEFKFTNTGKSDLVIRKTKASCGCTATEPAKSVLKPGESSSISVTFDTTGKSGKDQKTVTVISNDPKRNQLFLTISAEIAPGSGNGSN